MLLRFRIANHRSIKDEQTLSLVATPLRGEARPKATELPRTVRVVGIYGANASGKSNVLDALRWMQRAVASSQTGWAPDARIPRRPFKLDGETQGKPSFYELDFLHDGVRYSYGFEVDDETVQGEWLFSFPHGRARRLFERSAPREYDFGRPLTGDNARIARLTRPNSLFLSSAASNDHPLLSGIFHRLTRSIVFASQNDLDEQRRLRITQNMLEDDHLLRRVNRMLGVADLGIVGAELGRRTIPDEVISSVRESIARDSENSTGIEDAIAEMEKTISLRHTVHTDIGILLNLDEESAGTRVWLSLVGPLLLTLDQGDSLVIDEIDSSMHPHLSSTLIRLFKDPEINQNGAQLIFASHDTTLLGSMLDDQLLDRDEVWFTEKDDSAATSLYSLAEFHPRKDENVERGYLQGRYGAVPYLSLDKIRQIFHEGTDRPDEPTQPTTSRSSVQST